MAHRLKVGIAGSNFGLRVHAPAFRTAGFEPVRLLVREGSGPLPAAAEGLTATEDPDAFLAPGLDAVGIALPPDDGSKLCAAALSRGIAVFMEKPLAHTLAAAMDLVSVEAASSAPAMVDLEFSALAAVRRLAEIVRDRRYGAARQVQLTWRASSRAHTAQRWSWKADAARGGGVGPLYAAHGFHLLEDLLGPIAGLTCVSSDAGTRLYAPPGAHAAPESMALGLSFASGAVGSALFALDAAGPQYLRLEVGFERGFGVLENQSSGTMLGLRLSCQGADGLKEDAADEEVERGGEVVAVSRMMIRLRQAIEEGAACQPSLADGLRVQRLLDAAAAATPTSVLDRAGAAGNVP